MTDEELGKEWCERNGVRLAVLSGRFWWSRGDFTPMLWAGIGGAARDVGYRSEREAYADVGVTLRKVVGVADVPPGRTDSVTRQTHQTPHATLHRHPLHPRHRPG